MDASDVRYADTLKLFGKDTIWGIDANNTPTVEDPWNTTPSFGWPQISSTIAPAFGPPLTHIESGYGQIVGGAGAYVFWNDMLYADLTFYKGLPVSVLQAFNTGNSTTDALANVAPYWRVAIEPHWGDLYWEAGTFGMYGQVTPGRAVWLRDRQFSRRRFRLANPVRGRSIQRDREAHRHHGMAKAERVLRASISSNLNNTLNSFKANASFVWDHTYSVGFGYFNIAGSGRLQSLRIGQQPQLHACQHRRASTTATSAARTAPASSKISPISPSATARRFLIRPGTCGSACSSREYLHVFGGTTNFDGSFLGGTHNAQGNNTVFAYAWFAF